MRFLTVTLLCSMVLVEFSGALFAQEVDPVVVAEPAPDGNSVGWKDANDPAHPFTEDLDPNPNKFRFQDRRTPEAPICFVEGAWQCRGLWIQKVTVDIWAEHTWCDPDSYSNSFTYYEWGWLYTNEQDPSQDLVDVYSTANWDVTEYCQGMISIVGESRVIPVDSDEYYDWVADGRPEDSAPAAFQYAAEYEAENSGWNNPADPLPEGGNPVPGAESHPDGTGHSSGSAPNRPDEPNGWNDPNALSFTRSLYVYWSLCAGLCSDTDEEEEEQVEEETPDPDEGDGDGEPLFSPSWNPGAFVSEYE